MRDLEAERIDVGGVSRPPAVVSVSPDGKNTLDVPAAPYMIKLRACHNHAKPLHGNGFEINKN